MQGMITKKLSKIRRILFTNLSKRTGTGAGGRGVRWIKRRKERGEHGAVLAKMGLADGKGTGVIIVPVKRGAG